MKHALPVILFTASSLLLSQASAQDQPQEAAEQQTESQQLDTDLTPEQLEAAENDALLVEQQGQDDEDEEGSSRFIPTEEISQDLGVSFPVDI